MTPVPLMNVQGGGVLPKAASQGCLPRQTPDSASRASSLVRAHCGVHPHKGACGEELREFLCGSRLLECSL